MRLRLLVVMVAFGVAAGPIVSVGEAAPPSTPPAEAPPASQASFPLPKDAAAPKAAKGGGGRIQTFSVPRGREAVVTEVRGLLQAGRWEITKDEPSPSGNAIRLTVKKSGRVWKASFTGDDQRTVLILTAP